MIANDRQKHVVALLFFSACIGTEKPALQTRIEALNVIVIDAFASPGGDGSAGSPYKTFPPSVKPGEHLQVRSGLYKGPFVLPEGVIIEGVGEVVLYLEGAQGTVVEAAGHVTLHSLSLQGGATGLRVGALAELERVHLSGHHTVALEATPGARVDASDCVFKGLTGESKGIIATEATLRLDHLNFTGAYKRSIEVVRSNVTLTHSSFEGPRTAVHALDSTTVIQKSEARGGSGAAFFAALGAMTLEDVKVDGHEYALQTGRDTTLTVNDFTSRAALISAVALVKTKATMTRVTIEKGGNAGSIQSIESQLELSDSKVNDSSSIGLLVRKGLTRLTQVELNGIRAETDADGTHSMGDGVHVRDATAVLKNVTVRGAEGTSVFVTSNAQVSIVNLVSENAIEGALVVERKAKVEAKRVQSTNTVSPAVAVLSGGSLTLEALTAEGSEVPLWAECNEQVEVTLTATVLPKGSRAPCVRLVPSQLLR